MATVVEYAGLDPSWQHLAMFKLAQMVCTLCLLLAQSTSPARAASCANPFVGRFKLGNSALN